MEYVGVTLFLFLAPKLRCGTAHKEMNNVFRQGRRNTVHWQKATKSTTSSCVEVGLIRGMVAVRDSKNRGRRPFLYTKSEWDAFLDGVKKGEFDHFTL
jgi:Domain of unknown function (DUF397)